MIRMSTLVPTDKNRANAAASRQASSAAEYGEEMWALDPIDMMSVEDFVGMLLLKFGPEYLEPINYAWMGGEFRPIVS